jgi:acetyl/propionyl-CoA carboxylase alpha subunit
MSKLRVTVEGHTYEIEVTLPPDASEFTGTVNGEPVSIVLPDPDAEFHDIDWLIINGRPYEISADRDLHWIKSFSGVQRLEVQEADSRLERPRSGDGRVKAPIPGLVTRVLVGVGETVQAGTPIAYLEAMKMQNEIRAPFAGVVKSIHVAEKQTVARGEVLAEIG